MAHTTGQEDRDTGLTQQQRADAQAVVRQQIQICEFVIERNFNHGVKVPDHLPADYPHWDQNNSYLKFPALDQLEDESLGDNRYVNSLDDQHIFTSLRNPELRRLWCRTADSNSEFFYELTKRANMLEAQNKATMQYMVGIA